ncbi:HAMP domain-containing histidine kinase [bacterium]|nr:HAMP domain-containing histidine kinase [bacterium]MBU1994893.1 HAMP domain-containing histidine kinase [bacterium]
MNKLTKKSFYSFLTLYLVSSFIFLAAASYWFYSAQVSTQKSNNYYKMSHIADMVSSKVIYAHMMDEVFSLEEFPHAKVGLYDKKQNLQYGSSIQNVNFTSDFYMKDGVFTLISQGTASHLNIAYVVIQSKEYAQEISKIKQNIISTTLIVAISIIIIAVILSHIFLRPIKEKIQEIENFVKDTTHELNTPITALMMSTSRAKSKKVYDEKIIKNISISTKQLYDIYSSLSYLSFDAQKEDAQELLLDEVVKESIEYFNELLEKKNIALEFDSNECKLKIAPNKAKMLVNNLLSNAIKYSTPNTKIFIRTTKNSFTLKDEGIGIAKEKLHTIFERFTRANSYAGGFGVGLNIVDSIVKEYKYTIQIDSQENKGTTVLLMF